MDSLQHSIGDLKQTLLAEAGSCLLSDISELASPRSTLKFRCPSCNGTFISTARYYLSSPINHQCHRCTSALPAEVIQATDKYNGYYQYEVTDSGVDIYCPKHGKMDFTMEEHLADVGCPQCCVENVTAVDRSAVADFIIKSNIVHEHKYSYAGVTDVSGSFYVTCAKHGKFVTTKQTHLDKKAGCPICDNTKRNIDLIKAALDQLGIVYTTEKRFDGLVGEDNHPLGFDIYVPDRNLCIECDGEHHYYPSQNNGSPEEALFRFKRQQACDQIKDQFCFRENIKLFRIPYTVHHPDAFVKRYFTEVLKPERYMYSYQDLQRDVDRIAKYIKTFNYDKFAVYGIARGGLCFSIPLSYHFDGIAENGIITFQRYDGNTKEVRFDVCHTDSSLPIFVVDDLISSGITMNKAIAALKNRFPETPGIHPVVIFGEENTDGVHFVNEHPKQWIVFPYEV